MQKIFGALFFIFFLVPFSQAADEFELSNIIKVQKYGIASISFEHDGNLLMCNQHATPIKFLDWREKGPKPSCAYSLERFNGKVKALFHQKEKLFALPSEDNEKIELWSFDENCPTSLRLITDSIKHSHVFDFHPVEALLVVAMDDGSIEVWQNEAKLYSISSAEDTNAHTSRISSMGFNPLDFNLVTGDEAGNIKIWQLNSDSYEHLDSIKEDQLIRNLIFSPTGKLLLAVVGNTYLLGEVKMYKWEKNNLSFINKLDSEIKLPNPGKIFAFNSNGSILAAAGLDCQIVLFKIENYHATYLQTLKSHDELPSTTILKLVFHPTLDVLASVADVLTIKIWEKHHTFVKSARAIE